MIFELVAVVSAGFAGAGVALLLRLLVSRLPRWLVPAAAGLAMLGVSIALEYAWFGRTLEALPDRVELALAHENRAIWRPWTLVHPYVDRFIAVDHGATRRHEAVPEQRMTDLLVFARWTPAARVRAVFDCAEGRRADLLDGARFGEGGAIEGVLWRETGLEDPITRTACGGA